MKISDLKKSIKEIIVAELSEDVAYKVSGTKGTSTQSFPNDNAAREFDVKNSNITLSKLEEMAKISGDLATAIKNVINANPDMDNLSLKKAIKSDPAVMAALDGESLFDNQLGRFISLFKGERELGQRGRKVDLGNTLARKMAELEAQEQSLMNKLNKITQLKKELESSLGTDKINENQSSEYMKGYDDGYADGYYDGEFFITQEPSKINERTNKVNNIEEDVNFTFQGELTPAGETAQNFIKNNPEIKGAKLVKALSNDEEFQKALDKTEKITKKSQKDIFQNQTQRFYDLVMGNKELGQRGRKADPNVAAKRSEEEKAKEEKRTEKEKTRDEKERAKAPAQKPTSPVYAKTTTMVDMSDEPSDEEMTKAEKELKIDTPKPAKKVKLSADEEAKFNTALKGITAKADRIRNKDAKPDDLTLLKKAYDNADIKKLFKKAGEDLDSLVAGIIGKEDTGTDLTPDELI